MGICVSVSSARGLLIVPACCYWLVYEFRDCSSWYVATRALIQVCTGTVGGPL